MYESLDLIVKHHSENLRREAHHDHLVREALSQKRKNRPFRVFLTLITQSLYHLR